MSKPENTIIDDSTLSVTLTVGQLKALVREEVKAANGDSVSELSTPEQLAEKLKLPVSWVYEQSRLGKIPTHKLGRYIRFDLYEVLASQKKD